MHIANSVNNVNNVNTLPNETFMYHVIINFDWSASATYSTCGTLIMSEIVEEESIPVMSIVEALIGNVPKHIIKVGVNGVCKEFLVKQTKYMLGEIAQTWSIHDKQSTWSGHQVNTNSLSY